jgi:hypothetical protein
MNAADAKALADNAKAIRKAMIPTFTKLALESILSNIKEVALEGKYETYFNNNSLSAIGIDRSVHTQVLNNLKEELEVSYNFIVLMKVDEMAWKKTLEIKWE